MSPGSETVSILLLFYKLDIRTTRFPVKYRLVKSLPDFPANILFVFLMYFLKIFPNISHIKEKESRKLYCNLEFASFFGGGGGFPGLMKQPDL